MDNNNQINSSANDFIHLICHTLSIDHNSYDDNDRNNNNAFDVDVSFPNATISLVPFIQNAPSIICSSQDNNDGESDNRYNNNSCDDNNSNNDSTFDANVSFPNATTSSVPFIQNASSVNYSDQDNNDGENDNRCNN